MRKEEIFKQVSERTFLVTLACPSPQPVIYSDVLNEDQLEKVSESLKSLLSYLTAKSSIFIINLPFWTDLVIRPEFDKHKIKQALILENKRRTKNNKINTKSLYDDWALFNNYPICDELEEYGFNNFVWLFNMKENDYLNWMELKKLCKSYQENHIDKNPAEIYQILIDEGHCIPSISMLNQIYKDYKSIRSLFNINL